MSFSRLRLLRALLPAVADRWPHCIAHLADRFGNPVDSAQLEVDTGSAHLTLRAVRNLKEEGRVGLTAVVVCAIGRVLVFATC